MILVAGFVAYIVLGPPLGMIALLVAAVIEVAELYLWIIYLRRFRVQTGPEGLIGKRGAATGAIPQDALGEVRMHGALWRARCRDGCPAGAEVSVSAVEGLTLTVEQTERQGR